MAWSIGCASGYGHGGRRRGLMTAPIFSPSWHRVAQLAPRLRSHVHIHRHHYRGQLWHVLQDLSSQRSHRFTPAAHYIIGIMDGRRTVQEIWEIATTQLGDDAPTQDEMIRLLSQLHGADALQCDVSPDTSELFQRYYRQKRSSWTRRFMNPMAIRLPLFDPDKLLNRTQKYVRPLFGMIGAIVWLLVVGWAIILAGLHWPDLTQNITDRVLAPQNLLLLWLVYPIVKAAHEFGHAFATKVWGGEVHEMGVMFLVLMPIPYVDASSASSFREKHKRVIVGAGGMIVELFLASIALFVWLNIEPGAVRSITYNVMLIAGVSTVLFNVNPLLRFDGYYILGDLIEIQNLGTRSTKYVGYLCQRYLFGLRDLDPPTATQGERAWFVGYGLASFVYRMFVVVFIAMFVATKFFFIGILLALWAIAMMVVVPLVKNISKIFTSTRLGPKRTRAITVILSMVCVSLLVLVFVPVPSWTRAEGVVWVPGDAVVRAAADGFVKRVVAQPGSYVRRGDLLIVCHDMSLHTHIKVLEGRLEELRARYTAQLQTDQVQAKITMEEMNATAANLTKAEEEAEDLVIRSQADGVFIMPDAQDLPGKFVKKGELIAYTLDLKTITARVIVSQTDIGLVRQRTRQVEVRLADTLQSVLKAVILRETPAATDQLPSMTLAQQGGGVIATDPSENKRVKAFQKFFLVDIDFPLNTATVNVGGRVYVRFDHGHEPLANQWYRGLRQLFLARFNV